MSTIRAVCRSIQLIALNACFEYRDHQDGARRTMEDLLRDAAEEESTDAAASVATHNDQIASDLGGVVDDFVARIAFDSLGLTLDSRLAHGSREDTQTFLDALSGFRGWWRRARKRGELALHELDKLPERQIDRKEIATFLAAVR